MLILFIFIVFWFMLKQMFDFSTNLHKWLGLRVGKFCLIMGKFFFGEKYPIYAKKSYPKTRAGMVKNELIVY